MKESADRFAKEKNVPKEGYNVFYVVSLVLIATSLLSIGTLLLISSIELPDSLATYFALHLILPAWGLTLFFGLGKYFFYAKILEIHYLNKALSYLITKLDSYYWRKYRKQSPLTEGLFKMQQKGETAKKRLSKRQKRLVSVGLILLLVGIYSYANMDVFVEIVQDFEDVVRKDKMAQNELGRIHDGLTP